MSLFGGKKHLSSFQIIFYGFFSADPGGGAAFDDAVIFPERTVDFDP